jgi:hypothetical protein
MIFIFLLSLFRVFPSVGIEIKEINNKINYLNISKEIFYRQTFNDCAPYSAMAVINIIKGDIKDPSIIAKEMRWRSVRRLTLPQGLIDIMHKNNIRTEEYILKNYSNKEKIIWLKNQIDNGNPIILLVKFQRSQHYFTIIGYDEIGFMIYDSAQEKQEENPTKTIIDKEGYAGNRYYANNELMELWNSGGYFIFLKNWALVCN